MSWVYLDDSFLQKKDVKISPFDRGFLFGDAVYEVIPVYERKIFLFSEHITRLERSLLETGIDKLIVSLDYTKKEAYFSVDLPKDMNNIIKILKNEL